MIKHDIEYKIESKTDKVENFLNNNRFWKNQMIYKNNDYYVSCYDNGFLVGVMPVDVEQGTHHFRFRLTLPIYRNKKIGEGLFQAGVKHAISVGAKSIDFISPKTRRGWKERREAEGFECKSSSNTLNLFTIDTVNLRGYDVKIQ